MVIFYLPDWGFSDWEARMGKEMGKGGGRPGLGPALPWEPGWQPPYLKPMVCGTQGPVMSRALLAPFLHLASLDICSGFVTRFLVLRCPSDHPPPTCGHSGLTTPRRLSHHWQDTAKPS